MKTINDIFFDGIEDENDEEILFLNIEDFFSLGNGEYIRYPQKKDINFDEGCKIIFDNNSVKIYKLFAKFVPSRAKVAGFYELGGTKIFELHKNEDEERFEKIISFFNESVIF